MILAVTHTVSLLTAVVLVWFDEVETVVFVEVLAVLVETVVLVVELLVTMELELVVELVWLGEVATVVFVEVLVVLVETVGSVVGLLVIVESEPVVLESLVELVVTGVLESVVELSRKNYKFL